MDPGEHLEAQEEPLVATTGTEVGLSTLSTLRSAPLKKIALVGVVATATVAFLALVANTQVSGRSRTAEFQQLQEDFQHPFSIWQSAAYTGDKLSEKPVGYFKSDFAWTGPEVVISNVEGQIIEGFGGAFTESSAAVYKKLSADQQDQFIQDYFSADGLGYTLGRTHINSCDFSISSYSFDDHDGDVGLAMFDTTLAHDEEQLLPLIWAAQYMVRSCGVGRELKMLASPWSPPAWMKDQSWNSGKPVMDHSGKPCLKTGMEEVWANYIAKWIQSYRAKGVNIWAMTVQNEPLNNASWEACLMSSEEEANFLANYLGPVLRELLPDVQIFIYDHNKDKVADYALDVLANSVAAPYVSGVAYHWYAGDGWHELERLQDVLKQRNLKLLPSEATWEAYRWHPGTVLSEGDWSFGEGYAHDIIGDLNRGAIGWLDWNLVLDEKGGPNHVNNVCDAPIQVDLAKKEVYKHPQYYYIGHFSKFIVPNSVHLESTVLRSGAVPVGARPYGTCTGQDGLEATSARQPNGQVVAVILNCGPNDVVFKLKYSSLAAQLTIPAHGIQTYLFQEVKDPKSS